MTIIQPPNQWTLYLGENHEKEAKAIKDCGKKSKVCASCTIKSIQSNICS
jgi:hypothetical protein